MPAPKKRVLHTKEEVAKAIKDNARFKAQMAFVKTKFWPALCKATKSVEDAEQQLYAFNSQIMSEFLAKMKEVKLGDLRLQDKLSKDDPHYLDMLAMVELFVDMNVFDAKELIEGMREEIGLFKREEFELRPLDTLKTRWADEVIT